MSGKPLQLPIAPSAPCKNQPRNRAPHEFIDPWEIKPWSPESVLHQSIAQGGHSQDQPMNHLQHEFYDPSLPNHWNQQPTNSWLPAHWDQRTDYHGNIWSRGIQFHGVLHGYPYQFASSTPYCIPSYYRNDNLLSHSQKKAPAPKRRKRGSGNLKKAGNCPIKGSDNLKTVSADTVATLSSSNDTASTVDLDSTSNSNYTVELDATLACSNDTASTVDLHATFSTSNYMPSTLNGGSKKVSKVIPLRTVKVNRVGGILVQIKNNVEVEEDVQYLYSVESNEGKLVELVNLSEDLQVSQNQDLLQPESKNLCLTDNSYFETSDLTSLKGFTGDDPCSTLINNLKSYAQNTHEKHYRDACCSICNKSLIELHNNKCDLYHAECGHLYCVLCIKYLNFQSQCMKCNEAISSLRKIVL